MKTKTENRGRRKVIGDVFADASKYILTAGVIGSVISGKFIASIGLLLGLSFVFFALLAYFVTPKDRQKEV